VYMRMQPAAGPREEAPPVAAAPELPPSVLAGRSKASPGSAPARAPSPARPVTPATTNSTNETAAPPAPAAPAARVATLHFDSDVPGITVFLDRKPVGDTPVTIRDVAPGPHRLNLSLPGYEAVSETIEVEPGERRFMFKFKEVRLDARITVVHKHRIGSCTGTLIATPRGLRYDTTDRDDAFSAAILEIDTLEIAYLENRLRIGVRGGKRYDFSDPANNADHLFVFHRDVEKARERLRKGDPPAPE